MREFRVLQPAVSDGEEARMRDLMADMLREEREERRRLARLLHDDLQQTLAAARIGVDLLEKNAGGKTRTAARELEKLIDEAVVACRSFRQELCPHDKGERQ